MRGSRHRSDPAHPEHAKYRDWYVWSDTDQRYKDTRIIFIDYEPSNWTFAPLRRQYYWHRFFSHQPDLNYDNPEVQRAMLKVVQFWLDLGVDAFRVDATPYLYEREGTSCENLPETHGYLKRLRSFVDGYAPGTMLLSEANQWPEDVRPYFGGDPNDPGVPGDEFHMNFHFPVMPRIFMALARRRPDTHPRNPGPHPCPAARLPVGHVPALPRRADARNGHAGRTRGDVERLRARAAHALQPRHPAAPGAAARQRPGTHRAGQLDPVQPARLAGHLLRRRNRHGRQHLPRGPPRAAHADAVAGRPQRGLLRGRPVAALLPADRRRDVRLPPRECRRRSEPTRTRC